MRYTSLLEYKVPATEPIEYELLAALLGNPYQMDKAEAELTDDCFADKDALQMWQVLKSLNQNGDAIELSSVYPRVNATFFQKNIIPNMGKDDYHTIENGIKALTATAVKRTLYFDTLNLLQDVAGESTIDDLRRHAETIASRFNEKDTVRDVEHVTEAMGHLAEELEVRYEAKTSGKHFRVPTSFPTLDQLTSGGFGKGNLVILAARPSVGKTAVALQMAMAAAASHIPSMFFSLEMTNTELAERLIKGSEQFDAIDIATGDISWETFEQLNGRFAGYPLWLNDLDTEAEVICEKITKAHRQGKCDIAFIDYLGLLGSNGKDRYEQVTNATKMMKLCAKKNGIPVVLLCQLNRQSADGKREPELYDLRESGSIEQDADIVLMLQQKEQYDQSLAVIGQYLMLYVKKNRAGEKGGALTLLPNLTYTTFKEA